MRAVRFHHKRDIRVEEVAAPLSALRPKEVLVRPLYCGICGTDLHEYTDGPIVTCARPHPYTGAGIPQILGHEFSARVEAVGSAVSNVRPGDRVSIQPQIAPRDDYYGRRGLIHLSEAVACVGLSWAWGGMAEAAIINDYNVYRMPDAVDDVQAALIEPTAVAVHAVDRGGVRSGSTVLVSGAGPIGALAILAAKAAGASAIFVAETNANRRRMAKALAPEIVAVDPKNDDLRGMIRAATEEGVGVDAAIECAGAAASLNACLDSVRRQGIVVQVGLHTRPAEFDPAMLTMRDITLAGSFCYPVQIWPRIAAMIASGLLPVEKVVTAIIAPEEVVAKGFDRLLAASGDQAKILVKLPQRD